MIKRILLLMLISSFCIARDVPSLVADAEQLLGKLQSKEITVHDGQPEAQRLYDEIEQGLKEASKRADVQIANATLFKLSNYFALQTPASELAKELTSAIEGVEAEWQTQSGKSLTELISSGDVYALYSYVTLLFSKIGDFDGNTFFSILPYIGNMGYSTARDLIKRSFIYENGLTEPSPQNRALVEEALKKAHYDHDVIILENPDRRRHAAAAAWRLGPFRIIVANTYLFKLQGIDFILAHEIGHLYYSHTVEMAKKFLLSGILFAIINGCFIEHQVIELETPAPFIPIISALLVSLLSIPQWNQACEREADLFACHELIRQGKPGVVFREMLSQRTTSEHYEKYWLPTLTQTHPSHPERMAYLEQCLREHGLWG